MVKFTRSRYFALGLLLSVSVVALAETVSWFGKGAPDNVGFGLITLLAGEDQTNSVMKVEGQYTRCTATADTQCGSPAKFLHTINCTGVDAAAQAGGVITVYDNTAESGTIVYAVVPAAAAFTPVGALFDTLLSAGLYIGFPAGATDVQCTASYR